MAADSDCANPLLLKWLEEWLQNAREHNSKGVQTYKKAYESMKACPITFSHPSEAQQLHGLGPKLCDRLTAKLKAHCTEHGLPMPDISQAAQKRSSDEATASGPTKKPRKPKPYVPVFRSGPYAIILALSSAGEDTSRGFTKSEVIELAQGHCDSSFTAPSDPTKYFTAWNSMKTLMEKDLVFERGRPLRKYALTEDGWDVARRLRKTGHVNQDLLQGNDNPTVKTVQTTLKISSAQAISGQECDWAYLGSSQSASVEADRIGGRKDAGVPLDLDESSHNSGPRKNRLDITADTCVAQPNQICATSCASSPNAGFMELSSSPPEAPGGHIKLVHTTGARQLDQINPHDTCHPSPIRENEFPPSFQPLHLQPSEFAVHLVLDTREIRAKQDRDYIQQELTRKGVKPIMRSLELGDALWVARRKSADESGIESENDEVVLDWVVERKRLDDLIGSIKDGRFHEQKFRLRKSGVKNVVYIIEEISMTTESFSKHQEAVESAIASTQVVNGYFVKMTTKVDDTIRYLARMTAMLKSIYEGKTLNIIPTSILTPENYQPLLDHLGKTEPSTDYHITYEAFASLASKSESLTLRDVFLKMLMCTKGVTGDKALEIQKKWTTPRRFIEAFEQCGNDESGRRKQENLLVDELTGLIGRKKVGKGLSVKVAEVWGSV